MLACAAFPLIQPARAGALTGQTPEHSAPAEDRQLAYRIFKQLIEINTTHSAGSVTVAASALRTRLLDAGFPAQDVTLDGPSPRKQGLIAWLRGDNAQSTIVIFAHLDVVEANRADWTVDPFKLTEKDGYFYGRGTQDIKENGAIAVETLIRFKREGFKPSVNLLLLLTADEEVGPEDGMAWLLEHRPDLFRNVLFAINLDAGDLDLENGQPRSLGYEVAEKAYADFGLSAVDAGGHSSLPHPGNPLQRIADGLARLEADPFPLELNPITLGYFRQVGATYDIPTQKLVAAVIAAPQDKQALGALAAHSSYFNALLRATCVPTRFESGQANNALPPKATANINCRILPGHSPAEIEKHLVEAMNDGRIQIQYCSFQGKCGDAPDRAAPLPPPPLPAVIATLNELTASLYPGIPVVGEMETGASDSIYTIAQGLPTYGIAAVGIDEDDVRAHGNDERIRQSAFYDGLQFFYLLLKKAATQAQVPTH
jgi:acetylornithine deacetylase/succinyl-diaminopimelate desuccinylase-like protein